MKLREAKNKKEFIRLAKKYPGDPVYLRKSVPDRLVTQLILWHDAFQHAATLRHTATVESKSIFGTEIRLEEEDTDRPRVVFNKATNKGNKTPLETEALFMAGVLAEILNQDHIEINTHASIVFQDMHTHEDPFLTRSYTQGGTVIELPKTVKNLNGKEELKHVEKKIPKGALLYLPAGLRHKSAPTHRRKPRFLGVARPA